VGRKSTKIEGVGGKEKGLWKEERSLSTSRKPFHELLRPTEVSLVPQEIREKEIEKEKLKPKEIIIFQKKKPDRQTS